MINISFVKLIPSLQLNEDEEKESTDADHQQVERLEQLTETNSTLKVYAERHRNAVCYECPMHPAEAVSK